MASSKTDRRWKRWLGRAGNWVLDPSVVFSFDQNGFRRHALFFDDPELKIDMSGKVCVVTGANSGIGYATSLGLAKRGAVVWMLCRSASRGEAARQKLIHASGNEHIYLCCVDLSDLDRVQDEQVFAEIPHIDVLVHNAGVLLEQRSISAQGIEQTLATHLVGPFALTATLMPKMGRGSRVIWVSSGGMYTQKLNMRHLEEPPDPFDGVRAYAQVKRAMVIASEHLAAAVEPCGITVHCMHPGWASTPGVKTSIPRFYRWTRSILRTPEQGADTILWLAMSQAVIGQTGGFWFDRRRVTTHFLPSTRLTGSERTQLWAALHRWAEIDPVVWSRVSERRQYGGA